MAQAAAIALGAVALPFGEAHAQTASPDLLVQCSDASKKRDWTATVRYCTEAIASPQFNQYGRFDALRNRAAAQWELGRTVEALSDLDDAVKIGRSDRNSKIRPFLASTYFQRANFYLILGDLAKARADIAAMEVIEGLSHRAMQMRALLLEERGDLAGAERAWTERATTFEENPVRIGSLLSRAWTRFMQGKVDAAFADLDLVDQMQAGASEVPPNHRAWMLAERGLLDEAAASFMRTQQSGDTDRASASAISYLRGYVEAARGNFTGAVHAFGPATVDTDQFTGLVQAVAHLARQRAGMPSNMMLEATLFGQDKTQWNAALASYVLGSIKREQFEAAMPHSNPRQMKWRRCTFHFVLGQTAIVRGDDDEAKIELARAVDNCPPSRDYNVAMVRIWAKADLDRLNGREPDVAVKFDAPSPQAAIATITVTSATLGANCGVKRGNVTDKVAAICNGRETCALPGSRVNNPDPAFGCAKAFAVEWQCGGTGPTKRGSVPAVPNETRVLTISCNATSAPEPPPTPTIPGRITLVSATLGANCGAPRGNVTDKVAAICNGQETCSLPGSRVNNPDPAFGCPKAFAAEWECSGKPGTRRRGVPAIANEKHVLTMSCK